MDHTNLRRSGSDIDLESGGTIKEENGNESVSLRGGISKKVLKRVWSGHLGLESPEKTRLEKVSLSLYGRLLNSEITVKNVRETDQNVRETDQLLGMIAKKKSKSEKPPRPSKGLSLNASDVKLAKEMSELAMMKRKRIERMKTLKKSKKEKASFCMNSNYFAMVITILFFLVIFIQGFLGSHV